MMVTEVTKRLINVDEYYKMAEVGILKPSDRVELIQGDIYKMSPIGSRHASIVKKLSSLLNRLFGDEVIIGIQDPIRLDPHNEPEPDIAILKYQSDYYAETHPVSSDVLIIIEIADSSMKHDREVKTSLYASNGITDYWIVDFDKQRIEVYGEPKGGEYLGKKVFTSKDEIQLLGHSIKVSEIINTKS